jgi:hypothetical protein
MTRGDAMRATPLPLKIISTAAARKAQNGVRTPKGCPGFELKIWEHRHERFCCRDGSGFGGDERACQCIERPDASLETPKSCTQQCGAGGRRAAWRRGCARAARRRGGGRTHHRGAPSGISPGRPARCPGRRRPPRRLGAPGIPLGSRRRDRGRSRHRLRRGGNGGGMGGCCAGSGLLLVLHRSQPYPGFLGRLPVAKPVRVFPASASGWIATPHAAKPLHEASALARDVEPHRRVCVRKALASFAHALPPPLKSDGQPQGYKISYAEQKLGRQV